MRRGEGEYCRLKLVFVSCSDRMSKGSKAVRAAGNTTEEHSVDETKAEVVRTEGEVPPELPEEDESVVSDEEDEETDAEEAEAEANAGELERVDLKSWYLSDAKDDDEGEAETGALRRRRWTNEVVAREGVIARGRGCKRVSGRSAARRRQWATATVATCVVSGLPRTAMPVGVAREPARRSVKKSTHRAHSTTCQHTAESTTIPLPPPPPPPPAPPPGHSLIGDMRGTRLPSHAGAGAEHVRCAVSPAWT